MITLVRPSEIEKDRIQLRSERVDRVRRYELSLGKAAQELMMKWEDLNRLAGEVVGKKTEDCRYLK